MVYLELYSYVKRNFPFKHYAKPINSYWDIGITSSEDNDYPLSYLELVDVLILPSNIEDSKDSENIRIVKESIPLNKVIENEQNLIETIKNSLQE